MLLSLQGQVKPIEFTHMGNRIGLIDALLIALVYLLCLCIPSIASISGGNRDWIIFLLQVLFATSLFAFLGYRSAAHKRSLLALPLFLICFTNPLALAFQKKSAFDYELLVGGIFLSLSAAIAEETIFRGVLLDSLEGKADWEKILISSLAFALAHLISSSFSIGSLIQFGYSFAFGLFASYVYLKGFGLLGAISLHFLFNLINGYLFSSLGGQNSGLAFYAVNLVVGAMLIAYLVMLILLDMRKEKSRR